MAETVPTVYSWIEWWDDRMAHIFDPYRKPTNTMWLVHAAHDDVSSMIFREVKVYLFDRNMMRSTGMQEAKQPEMLRKGSNKSLLQMILLKHSAILQPC